MCRQTFTRMQRGIELETNRRKCCVEARFDRQSDATVAYQIAQWHESMVFAGKKQNKT